VKRVVYLVVVALVALMILVPTAMAQDTVIQKEQKVTTVIEKDDLPKSGGPAVSSVLIPAAALLVGAGVVSYAVLRRR
jgi:hypothetical protein